MPYQNTSTKKLNIKVDDHRNYCHNLGCILLTSINNGDIDTFIDKLGVKITIMKPVKTKSDVEAAARKTIENLYGPDFKELKIRETLPFISDQQVVKGGLPTEDRKDSWDVQVTFLLDGTQYTVDLVVMEKDGQIINARLIDKMTPL